MVVLTALQGRRKALETENRGFYFVPHLNLLDPLSEEGLQISLCRLGGFRRQPIAHSSAGIKI